MRKRHGYYSYGIFIFVLCTFCFIVNDQAKKDSIPIEPGRIQIEQVMEHQMGVYSIKYKQQGNTALIEKYAGGNIKIIPDVPADQPMFALFPRTKSRRGNIRSHSINEIHIHSAKDINGGGWHFGKNGGNEHTTIVME